MRDVLVRGFYTGREVTSRTAIAVVLDRLDEAELQLANARAAALNGNGRKEGER
jgi:hypothetical protein